MYCEYSTTVDCPCIQSLVSSKAFCTRNFAVIQTRAVVLSACVEYEMNLNRVSEMKATIYGQFRREYVSQSREIASHRSLLSVPSFSKTVKDASGLFLADVYFVTTIDAMINLQFGISKRLKDCLVGYVCSRVQCYRLGGNFTVARTLLSPNDDMLCACNSFFAFIGEQLSVTGMRVAFPEGDGSLQLNCLYANDGTHDMLEEKFFNVPIFCLLLLMHMCTRVLDKLMIPC